MGISLKQTIQIAKRKGKRSSNLGVNGVDGNRSSNVGSHGERGLRGEVTVVIESSYGDEIENDTFASFFYLCGESSERDFIKTCGNERRRKVN